MNQEEREISHREMASDEIDLIDLFLIVWKRKIMIVAVTLLVTLAAVGISLILPKVYAVTAILEPSQDAEGKLVENPQTIRENILGGAYDQFILEKINVSLDVLPKFIVSIPKQTDLVKISVESADPNQAVLVIQALLELISSDIQLQLDLLTKKTENEIRQVQLEGDFLLEQDKLLKSQIRQIELKINALEEGRGKAIKNAQGDAMAVLLYSNEIKDQQFYLNDMHAKLISIKNKRNSVALRIDNIRLKIEGIKGTTIHKEPSISEHPIKPKKSLIVALAFVLGLMGGVMLAFLAEFMSKVKQQQKIQGEG